MKTMPTAGRTHLALVTLLLLVLSIVVSWPMAASASTDPVGRIAGDVTVSVEVAPEFGQLPPETVRLLESLSVQARFMDIGSENGSPAFALNLGIKRDESEVASIHVLQEQGTYLSIPELLDNVLKVDLAKVLALSESANQLFALPLSAFDLPGLAGTADKLLQSIGERLPERSQQGTRLVQAGGFEREYQVETQALKGEAAREALLGLADVLEHDEPARTFFMEFLRNYTDKELADHPDKAYEAYVQDLRNFINSYDDFENVVIAFDSYYDETGALQGGVFRLYDDVGGSEVAYRRVTVIEENIRYTDHVISLPDATTGYLSLALADGDQEDAVSGSFRAAYGPSGIEKEIVSGTVTNFSMRQFGAAGPQIPVGRVDLEIPQDEKPSVKLSIANEAQDDHFNARVEIDQLGSVLLTLKTLDPTQLVIPDPAAGNVLEIQSQEDFFALLDQEEVANRFRQLLTDLGLVELFESPSE